MAKLSHCIAKQIKAKFREKSGKKCLGKMQNFRKWFSVFAGKSWQYTFVDIVIYTYILCLSVCLFVTDKRPNGWTDRWSIFCLRPHMTHGKISWIFRIFTKTNIYWKQFFVILILGTCEVPQKKWPDQYSRFDVYRLNTNKQTGKVCLYW